MDTSNLSSLTLTQAVALLKKKEITIKDLVKGYCEVIEKDNARSDKLNAVLYLDPERAIRDSDADKLKPDSLLAGAPIFIKNNMHLEGFPVGCASHILEGYRSPYTGGACRQLLSNGGVVMGITNMDEFAMGSSNEFSYYGIVRNPHHREYIPGGSSGGSAALIGGGLGLAALGSDTGGSIRQPASCCGIIGLKPTYGRVSRYGLTAFASSFDQIGPMTRTVSDAALLLQAIAGFDEKDSTCSERPVPNYTKGLENNLSGKKIACPKEFFSLKEGLDSEIKTTLDKVRDFYTQAGCIVEEVSMPLAEYAIAVYYILTSAEASSNLSRFDGIRYGFRSSSAQDHVGVFSQSRSKGFGPEVKRRILTGTHVLSSGYYEAYYGKAQKVRKLIQKEYLNIMAKYDAILTPVMPGKVFKLGEKLNDPISMYFSDIFTVSTNVVGAPAISIPGDWDSQGLPIGFQLVGRLFDEETLLNLSHIYQKEKPLIKKDSGGNS